MSRHVYSEINLHITWHTENSLPLIREAVEGPLHQFIKDRVIKTDGAYFHAIGGIETHVHLVTTVVPSLHIDEWIGQLKGASSHEFGKQLQWQTGYGVVSFGTKDRQWVVDYVNGQREHHKGGTAVERLERILDER
jgi:putative transposase